MLTREQLEADVLFLANRAKSAGQWRSDGKRDWGISSNSLVSYAYGVGMPEMPSDWGDYAACVRVARKLPQHRLTPAVKLALGIQREAVEKKYPAEERRSYGRSRRFPETAG